MSDLINRQDVNDLIKQICDVCGEGEKYNGVMCGCCRFDDFIGVVDNIPSAESERKKGTWEVQPSTGDDRPFIWWKCSVCGHVIFSETERDRKEFHAYCGRCGADMTRGEE